MSRWYVVLLLFAGFGATGAAVPAQTPPPFEPCPRADVSRPEYAPPAPSPPVHAPGDRAVGGPGLDTEGLTVPPGSPELPETISATSWVVADLDSGKVLGACGPHRHGPPASTLKLLLALTLLDELDPDDDVQVTDEDMNFEVGSSAVGLVSGGEYSIETLWLGLLLDSGNDAARVLARVGGGADGLDGGLAAMNETARDLGARQTFAATASGLDGPGQLTSAYDLALIARAVFDNEDFRRYTTTERADMPAQPDADADGFEFQNGNPLLHSYDGALGGKTGYTDLARHTYVGAAERDGRRLVVTLLGAEVQPVRGWRQGAALLDWGFALPAGASVGRLVERGELAEPTLSSTPAPTFAPAPVTARSAAPGSASPVGASTSAVAVVLPLFALASVAAIVVVRRRRSGT